jgi:molybdenum cofactor biosynthesis enzyme MoaA
LDTNGFLLSHYVKEIVNSGLREIHVSYPSCERERSEKFFGIGYPKESIDNSLIEQKEAEIEIALNALLVQGINYNEEDIESLLNYALRSRFRLRFFNELRNYHNNALFVRLVEDVLTRYNRILIRETERIREYRICDTIVVEIIDPCTPEFYNPILWNEVALFLTPSGKVKRMFGEQRYDLLGAVGNRNVERVEKTLELVVQRIIYGHGAEGDPNAFKGTERPT